MLAPFETPRTADVSQFLARALPYPLLAIITVGLLAFTGRALCPDVAGQFWYASAMRRGVRLYTDIVEINPPLWFWMAMPIDALADWLRVRTEPLTILAVAALVLLAMAAVGRLLTHLPGPHRLAFLAYLAAVLLIMPARQLEQREHLALIAAVPYLVLAATRHRRDGVSPLLAAAIGVSAGLGLALKPYFVAVPLVVECWHLAARRRTYRPLRPETIALAALGVVYGAAVLLFAPDYIAVTVPLFGSAYGAVASSPVVSSPLLVIWLLLALPILSQYRAIRAGRAPVTAALLIGAAGFAIAWAIQHKAWFFHGLPTTGCLALALAAVVAEVGLPRNKALGVTIPALLLLPLLIATVEAEMPITPENDIAPAVADLRAGDPFGLVSATGATNWPALVNRGLRLSSRYGQYWILHAIEVEPGNAALAALGQRVIRETAFDYRCLPPKVIVFTRPGRDMADAPPTADPLRYFLRVPEFADVLSHYRLWRSSAFYDAYRQVSPLAPVDRTLCRRA